MSEKPKDKNATVEDTDYGFQRQVGLLMFALSIECVKSLACLFIRTSFGVFRDFLQSLSDFWSALKHFKVFKI